MSSENGPRSIEVLLREAHADAKRAPEFFHSLLTLELFAVGRRKTVSPGDFATRHFELVAFADGAGEPFVPVFSDRAWVPVGPGHEADHHRVVMHGRDLLEMARGSRVVLNPGRPEFKVFSPEQIETILDRISRPEDKGAI